MLLERKLVKILWKENQKGILRNRRDFVKFVAKQTWPFLRWCFYDTKKFTNTIDFILGDCMKYDYINCDDKSINENIEVTTQGRDFIKIPLGFSEEFLKRRKRTVIGVVGTVLVIGLTWFTAHFWP